MALRGEGGTEEVLQRKKTKSGFDFTSFVSMGVLFESMSV